MINQSTQLLFTVMLKKVWVSDRLNFLKDLRDFFSDPLKSISLLNFPFSPFANVSERHVSIPPFWRRMLLAFGIALGFFYVGVMSGSWFGEYFIHVFGVIGSMLLSFTLANRYHRLLKEKLQLETDLQTKEKDLSMLVANNKIRYNERKKFLGDLHELARHNSKDLQKNLKSQALNLIKGLSSEEKFLHRSDHMELLNASFEEKLKTAYPDLSKTELEICGYIKTNLSVKEIAELRRSSEGAIKMARHRLKAKMQLEDQDLDNFIRSTF